MLVDVLTCKPSRDPGHALVQCQRPVNFAEFGQGECAWRTQ
jgi:hypothetical protein